MKNKVLYLIMAFFLMNSLIMVEAVNGEESAKSQYRLMTYNVHNGIGLDGEVDYARIARVIARCNPDVIAVQELDSMTQRSKGKVVLNELAVHTGMHATFAAAIAYGGGKYGIGILSKEKPLGEYRIALPGREEARVLLVVEFSDYVFACTHLSLTEEDRMLSIELLRNVAERTDKPLFLAGDWNAHPEEPFMKQMATDFRLLTSGAQPTFPADNPQETIDYIAVSVKTAALCKLEEVEVVEETIASDHRPVWCDVSLTEVK